MREIIKNEIHRNIEMIVSHLFFCKLHATDVYLSTEGFGHTVCSIIKNLVES